MLLESQPFGVGIGGPGGLSGLGQAAGFEPRKRPRPRTSTSLAGSATEGNASAAAASRSTASKSSSQVWARSSSSGTPNPHSSPSRVRSSMLRATRAWRTASVASPDSVQRSDRNTASRDASRESGGITAWERSSRSRY